MLTHDLTAWFLWRNEVVVDVIVWTCLLGIMTSSSHPLQNQRTAVLSCRQYVWFAKVDFKRLHLCTDVLFMCREDKYFSWPDFRCFTALKLLYLLLFPPVMFQLWVSSLSSLDLGHDCAWMKNETASLGALTYTHIDQNFTSFCCPVSLLLYLCL